jgi:hypothetical protein
MHLNIGRDADDGVDDGLLEPEGGDDHPARLGPEIVDANQIELNFFTALLKKMRPIENREYVKKKLAYVCRY